MEITITQSGSRTMVVLNGRLDTSNADQFQKDIEPLMKLESPDIEMDCSGMEYTSSQGLRMFLMLQKNVMGQ